MAFKFDDAAEGYSSNLELFKAPPINTGIYKREWVSFRPTTPVTRGSPIHFTIPPGSSDYKDLRKTMLYVKCRILKADGSKITINDKVGFANLILHTLFRQLDVSLQQNVINPSVGQNYSYKAMFDTLLNHTEVSKKNSLESQGFSKDGAGFMDSADPLDGSNKGLQARWHLSQTGDYLDLEGPLYSDLCQQDRLLINGVQVDVKLYPNNDSFALMAPNDDEKYYFEIEESILKVCHVKMNPALMLAQCRCNKEISRSIPLHAQ